MASSSVLKHLWGALGDFELRDLIGLDLLLGFAAGVGGLVLGLHNPDALLRAVVVSAGIVGVILGAVIAGVSIQVAFFDQAFLRKVRLIGRDPIYFLSPFLYTAVLGIASMLGLIVLATLSNKSPTWLLSTAGCLSAFFGVYAVASLLHGLATLVQFVGLKMDALDVPDGADQEVPRRRDAV